MVYKVIGKFTDENFDKIIKKISGEFKFIYCYNALYLSVKDVKKVEGCKLLLKQTFRPVGDFFIQEINETNIMKEESTVMEWCRDNLLAIDQQRFENEQQEKLKQAWLAMDNMEK